MASLVRLIGVPTERPFPSVLGEPSKVTTATHLGQAFFAVNNIIAEQRFQTVETGVEGAPRLSASVRGLAPVRRTSNPTIGNPACQHPRTSTSGQKNRSRSS